MVLQAYWNTKFSSAKISLEKDLFQSSSFLVYQSVMHIVASCAFVAHWYNLNCRVIDLKTGPGKEKQFSTWWHHNGERDSGDISILTSVNYVNGKRDSGMKTTSMFS